MRHAIAMVCVLWAVSIAAAPSPITILYTNDLHLRFGRIAAIERRIAEERAAGAPVLLLDAGDAWQDFRRPLAAVWGADEMVEWMSRVGYDAMALGNHDMYWGARRLDELAHAASFPILCANLRPIRRADPPPFVASTRLELDGIEILAIGLITEECLPYLAYPTLRWVPATRALKEEIDRASIPGALVVVIAHLPVADAIDIAARVPEVDVFVTGHSHEKTEEPVHAGETLIVQAGAFGENLGRLVIDVDPDTGGHRLVGHELIPMEEAPTDPGRGLVRLFTILTAAAAVTLLVVL